MIEATAKHKLKPITRGADWFFAVRGTKDGVPYDMRLYQWESHFKDAQGVEIPITIAPDIVVDENLLMLKINDYQTEKLAVGTLFYNILRTQAATGWNNGLTEAIMEGTVRVKPGVTNHVN